MGKKSKKNILESVLNHLNKNQGAYNFLLAVVVGFIAVISFILTISPLDKEADIQLYTDLSNEMINLSNEFLQLDFDFYIFNGGSAPCFDIKLTAPIFIQRAEIIFPEARIVPALVEESKQETTFFLGTINPDETIKMGLKITDLSEHEKEYIKSKLSPSNLEVECVDDLKNKKIYFK
jgi:hypothetical protein